MKDDFYTLIFNAVSGIPAGRVATYGQIASLCGLPGYARMVGRALSELETPNDVPWHRVINARGEISEGGRDGRAREQRALLAGEGIQFDRGGRINLKRFQY